MDYSKYVHMWHISWYLTNFDSPSSNSSPWGMDATVTPGTWSSTSLQQDIQQIHGMLAQPGIQQISSCLVLSGTDSLSYWWHCLVACGMQQLGSCLGRLQQQVAVVILTHYSSAVSATDGGEPAGADGTGTLSQQATCSCPSGRYSPRLQLCSTATDKRRFLLLLQDRASCLMMNESSLASKGSS